MPGRRGAPERFLTTVLMTDIVGSTDHAAELGDSAWRELVQQHHALVRAALRRHGGREIDTAGDGFFATFDAPAAAVRCALEISEAVGKLGLEVRAGIHVGEVEQIGRKVGGITVPIASRIMAGAAAGEVLVSSTVRDLAAGSGLAFHDRGERELKGVPGEWHVFAVARADAESTGALTTSAGERRAAAVRRAGTRPIWQRRPRLVAATAVGLAAILATTGLWIWKPWQVAALATVMEDSIGIIDPGRIEVVGQIPVGTRPGGIGVSDGYAWVTNTGADSVSQVDLSSRKVVLRIDVGHAPKGIAIAEGSVWVANSNDRTVSRINIAASRVVGAIEVGNGPTAIVAAGSNLWVANATDSTVVAIDARSGAAGEPVGVAAGPIALAADATGLWVLSEDAASVSHLDAASGVTLAAPIQLAARPSAIALAAGSVWVASTDGTVTRIETSTGRVTATVPVGGALTAIVASTDAVWVGDQDGNVYLIDAANPSSPARRISTTSAVASLAFVDGSIWLAAQGSAASHRGGTLRIVATRNIPGLEARYDADPLGDPLYNVAQLETDGLLGHRRVGGTAGSVLLPDLATSIPTPTNGGLTYTFQLRQGLEYSTGAQVRASDFRRGIERSFQVAGFAEGSWGLTLFTAIAGAEACGPDTNAVVERCDLSTGIVTNDDTGMITFHLSTPDPDFLYKLAGPASYPVPDGTPMNEVVTGPFPGMGPYMVGAITATELRMVRNPRFRVWDASVRPDGFPDEIAFTFVADDAQRIALVENGEADYTAYRGEMRTSPELFARLKTEYAGQWHVGDNAAFYIAMNTAAPPFNNVDARRAVNFAIDRAHMADLFGGPPDAAVTCQLLPPGWPGYAPTCPYTFNPDEGGLWKQPDMAAAHRLVDSSGTLGAHVVLGPTFPFFESQLVYLKSVLEELGYDVSIDEESDFEKIIEAMPRSSITINGWAADYVAPSAFLILETCGGDLVVQYCDASFDAAYEHARSLQVTDQAAANVEWTALDHRAVDLALMAPLFNAGGDFVSARVGNFQLSPTGFVLFDQMWVQ